MAYTTIDNPGLYFNTVVYAGSNSDQSVTGVGFQPDWVWIKNRSSTPSHMLNDAVRGAGKQINSDNTDAELDRTYFMSFDSDGFTLDGNVSDYNQNSSNFVSWNWLAGDTASSNSDGSITSSVSVNTTAGFSIVSYTGTGSNATIGHGLGVVPDMVIVKCRSASGRGWTVWHNALPGTHALDLNGTDAQYSSTSSWNSTVPTSSVFSVGTRLATNDNTETFIAYLLAEKKGYSKFGTYTGNGNADGTFAYTGFRPAFVMCKRTSGTGNWQVFDSKREGFNVDNDGLQANLANAEATDDDIDILSTGFKLRGTGNDLNGSGSTYIYMAFAENPFVTTGTKAAGTAR